jgi:hypothetical protein
MMALMFLRNYTSEVPVSQTIYRIEQVLIKCGVLGISKEYTGVKGEVSAIMFHIKDNGKDFTVRLPANKDQAQDALFINYADGSDLSADGQRVVSSHKKKRRSDFAQQAERTAWKIVQEWVEIQMSMIQMKQAESLEVFMPYVWDGESTVFQRVKGSGYRALLPEKAS